MKVNHPLRFAPIYKPKPWGKEIWTLADLDETALGGGGGEAAQSLIDAGPFQGQTLRSLLLSAPESFHSCRLVQGGFPLLCKILEACSDLSLQVHPTAAYASTHPHVRPKSEAWYVLEADADAGIYLGLEPGTSPEVLRAAVLSGHAADHVVYRPVKRGELYYLPAGTCHALGAGVRVAEVQSPSDTTFRLYDWHRLPKRELHLDAALACADFTPWSNEPFLWAEHQRGATWTKRGLMRSSEFSLALCSCDGGFPFDAALQVWMMLEGGLQLGGIELSEGQTAVLPCGYEGEARGQAVWIEIRIPV